MHRIKALFFLLLPVVLLSACRNDLSDSQWVLTDIVGKTVPLSGKAYMRFHQNEKTFVDGSGGCNRFSGNFTVVGSALRVGPLISTRMACPDMREERAIRPLRKAPSLRNGAEGRRREAAAIPLVPAGRHRRSAVR